ncbi:hypothetical protein [Pseudomonas phage Itty13]|uniref:Uncharacterized protein n=1 Tax=Pseudomonas phage Itty13 TaxID=2805750 RepID=A0A889IQH5_9CAUD|nr:hypothetical protein PQC19_gp46 [Pseudomonas phage Itty13]QRE00622.1 hypothetical protein [Pseudomonas phage Itty13]
MLTEQQRRTLAQRLIETYIANCHCSGVDELRQAIATMQEMANDCAASIGEGRAILVAVDMDGITKH